MEEGLARSGPVVLVLFDMVKRHSSGCDRPSDGSCEGSVAGRVANPRAALVGSDPDRRRPCHMCPCLEAHVNRMDDEARWSF
jgi:hypothetical protein